MKLTLTFCFFFLLTATTLAQPGTLDQNFGNGGLVISANPNDGVYYAISTQTDGKLLVAGVGTADGITAGFSVGRYNGDGSIDGSFGKNGIAIADIPGYYSVAARSMTILPDGKIITAGWVANPNIDIAIVCFFADGSVDSSFGTDGVVLTDLDYSEYVSH